ncbi:unnamed protein product, partial [Mesorhabditis belari]|uniref:Globin family profile domain-containing protein n=1 Tax=Mesorhabditis belari TaxID=2138241 RepID=A0AAF3FDM5_9BILA
MSTDKEEVAPTSGGCCCSMPSLEKARGLFSSIFAYFHGPSANNSIGDKSINGKAAPFHTPQIDRKVTQNEPQAHRRSSMETINAHSSAKNNESRGGQITHPNIEAWDPDVYEKELLRRTWSDDFDFLYELGAAIYCYIFDHNPNCKQLFPFISTYQGDDWKHSKEFRSQALKFVQTLAQTVKNVYHMDRVEVFLYGIGQRHCKFAERGFKAEYWNIFQDAMEHSLADHMNGLKDLNDDQKKDAVRVWRTLALYVTTHMSHGFFDGMKGVNKFAEQ